MRSKHKLRNTSTLAGISVFFLLAVLRPAAAQDIIVPDGFVAEVFADGLLNPQGLAFDSDGNLISASVGSGEVFSFDDVGNRSLVAFNFSRPIDVVVDGNLLFVTDLDFNGVFTIDLNGSLPVDATTLTPLVSGLDGPTHLEFGPSGDLFVSVLRGIIDDRVVKVDVTTGTAIDFVTFPDDANHNPQGKAFDANGDMFLAIQSFGQVRRVSFTETTPLPIDGATLPVVIAGLDSPGGVDFGEDGRLYIATPNEVVASETSTGTTTTFASGLSGSPFNNLLFDEDGQLFVADGAGGQIIRIFQLDTDDDGIPDDEDLCPDTVIPEATVPSVRLGTNRWALMDDDFDFDTTPPKGKGPKRSYNTTDTRGCSCEQIIVELGLGNGHTKFGCSSSAMDDWVANPGKRGAGADATEVAGVPEAYVLEGNYPNPFNPTTEIRFDLPEAAEVRLIVYDVMGREVARLVDGAMPAGQHRARWDASGLPSGLYLYRLTAGPFSQTKAMALLK